MSKIIKIFILLCTLLPISSAASQELGLELLPKGRLFRLTFADPREIKMGLLFEGDSGIKAAIGNYFSIFAIRPEDDSWQFHFGLEGAGFFGLRQEGSRFPLETTDGLLGVYTEFEANAFKAQLRFTHVSAHLADGASGTAIPYSREFANFRLGYEFTEMAFLYAGVSLLVNSTPVLPPWSFQAGGYYFVPLANYKFCPFVAADFKYKTETKFNPSVSLYVGLALNNPPEAYRSFRFFYSFFSGDDPRGQYYTQFFTSHSFGIEMQI